MNLFRISVLSVVLIASPAFADDAVGRGAAVVEEWCRFCHLRAGEPPNPEMAPPFEQIVMREGRDRAFFQRFLHEDHFPMPFYRLFDHEKDDVVAWLMALQKEQQNKQK